MLSNNAFLSAKFRVEDKVQTFFLSKNTGMADTKQEYEFTQPRVSKQVDVHLGEVYSSHDLDNAAPLPRRRCKGSEARP